MTTFVSVALVGIVKDTLGQFPDIFVATKPVIWYLFKCFLNLSQHEM